MPRSLRARASAGTIGILYRDRDNIDRALFWLTRALSLGNDDSGLEIAKIHLGRGKDVKRGVKCLERLASSRSVSEATEEEVRDLLKTYRTTSAGPQRIH